MSTVLPWEVWRESRAGVRAWPGPPGSTSRVHPWASPSISPGLSFPPRDGRKVPKGLSSTILFSFLSFPLSKALLCARPWAASPKTAQLFMRPRLVSGPDWSQRQGHWLRDSVLLCPAKQIIKKFGSFSGEGEGLFSALDTAMQLLENKKKQFLEADGPHRREKETCPRRKVSRGV